MSSAQRNDQAGALAEALTVFLEALAHYRGDFIEGIDSEWIEPVRLRRQSLVLGAMCRVGELLLARGEPEEAAGWAVRAQTMSSLDERAARLLANCLRASGDRMGAIAAIDSVVAALRARELPPAETLRVIELLRY